MKFTDGFWHARPGVNAQYAQQAHDVETDGRRLVVSAPTKVIGHRGDTLNRTLLTVSLSSPAEGVIGVRIQRHRGTPADPGFDLIGAGSDHDVRAEVEDDGAGVLESGALRARVGAGTPWDLTFESGGELLTRSGRKSIGSMTLAPHATVSAEPAGITGVTDTGLAPAGHYLHAQLGLDVGELIYGLGERFGPLVKNGQSVDIWHADGGTATELAYKNVPFYLSNRGYGVLINHRDHVSFEVGSENVEQVQFSVAGESLEFYVIAGPTPAQVLSRYTALTGRAPHVPDWSYGLWLSTSFTTSYDEATVNSFVDGMAERDIPLSVFHFDCFWMREFNWTDFAWDARVFPDPEGMLARLRAKGLHLSAWLNPYIGQRSALFDEAAEQGFLVRRADGSVWQWDMWQAGMALVDFTNPGARTWYQDKVRALLRQGIDAIKTDFGERIPTDVIWHDGSRPRDMHNWYTQLYNEAVFSAIEAERGEGEAVLFARSATTGGQRMPVHWGGDNSSTFVSMAESLRGGLSLALSGFAHWSHDVGGFEGMPDAEVFKRWVAFGLLSSHTRLHGSSSYRVPWLFDEAEGLPEDDPHSAVSVTRTFATLKASLLPYLRTAGHEASRTGMPVMRPMVLAFPDDPAAAGLDRQYLLGPDLLVAPVFSANGQVDFYLPEGTWTHLLTGQSVTGGGWRRETHAVDSVPVYVRPGAVLPRIEDDVLTLGLYPGGPTEQDVQISTPDPVRFAITRTETGFQVTSPDLTTFAARTPGGARATTTNGTLHL